jgi:hypothetical protein
MNDKQKTREGEILIQQPLACNLVYQFIYSEGHINSFFGKLTFTIDLCIDSCMGAEIGNWTIFRSAN